MGAALKKKIDTHQSIFEPGDETKPLCCGEWAGLVTNRRGDPGDAGRDSQLRPAMEAGYEAMLPTATRSWR